MQRNATAVWQGNLNDGKGFLSSDSKALDNTAYSFASRFENGTGTNPEELIAAAHAGCFSMMMSLLLSKEKFTADKIETRCEITMNSDPAIASSKLIMKAKVPGISKEQFARIAEEAKKNCPISKVLSASISLEYTLES